MRRHLAPFVLALLATACGDGPSGPGDTLEVLGSYETEEENDRQVLHQMVAAGADLTKATDVRWYVYFPTTESRATFAAKAKAAGWKVELLDGSDEPSWLALCSRETVVDLAGVRATRRAFAEMGEGLDADIDGWEAAITR